MDDINLELENVEITEHKINGNTTGNLRFISSWNCWGVPFGAKKIFHRQKKWRIFNDQQVIQQINFSGSTIDIDNDLIISAFQEVWSFNTASFLMNIYSNTNEQNWKPWKEICILVLSLLIFPFSFCCRICCRNCCIFDSQSRLLMVGQNDIELHAAEEKEDKEEDEQETKDCINERDDEKAEIEPETKENNDRNAEIIKQKYIPFNFVIGSNGCSMKCYKLLDSGLCILSTWRPMYSGFRKYDNNPKGKNSERLANKGILWAYFTPKNVELQVDEQSGIAEEMYGTLVINSHLSCRGGIKELQLQELISFVKQLKIRFIGDCQHLEIFIMGDFNFSSENEPLLYMEKELELNHISSRDFTNTEQTATIDHIWAWKSNKNKHMQCKSSVVVKPWESEDGCCPKNCIGSENILSDHCWISVVI